MGIAALAGGAGLICWNGGIGVFAIDLKLGRVTKIATLSDVSFVIPYKSFYTPGIKLMPCFILFSNNRSMDYDIRVPSCYESIFSLLSVLLHERWNSR